MTANGPLLQVSNLRMYYATPEGVVKAVDGVSFSIKEGKVLGLIGESGCGKTSLALTVMRLQHGKIIDGSIMFNGVDLTKLHRDEIRKVRGKGVFLIPQQPLAALDPVLKVGEQIVEAIKTHIDVSGAEAESISVEILRKLGLPEPIHTMKRYAFELSGGMAQRIVIAMALALRPKLLIADEPTTALDVTIQAEILELFKQLIRETGASVLYVTHDLAVAFQICDHIAVMYAGKIVEIAEKKVFFETPTHPYSQALLQAVPKGKRYADLYQIAGEVPDMINLPGGCRFNPRCPYKMEVCEKTVPTLFGLPTRNKVACHLYDDGDSVEK